MRRNRSKSSRRGYADQPAMINFGWYCARQPADLVHVDAVVLLGHLVRGDVVEQPGEVDPHAVREVPAVGEGEAEDGVARLDQRLHGRRVRLRTGMRLHVGESGAEQRLDPLDRERLDDVDVLAAAVVPAAGVALGVLVRQHAALRLHRRDRGEVLRRDHLQRVLLAPQLAGHVFGDLGVRLGERRIQAGPGPRLGHRLGRRPGRCRGGHVCSHDLVPPRWALFGPCSALFGLPPRRAALRAPTVAALEAEPDRRRDTET